MDKQEQARIDALRRALADSQRAVVGMHQSRAARLFHAYDTTLGRLLPVRPPVAPRPAVEPLKPDQMGAPGSGRDVVVFPMIPWRYRRQRIHHVAGKFAAAGHRVFYLATKLGPLGSPYEARRSGDIIEVDLSHPSDLDIYKDVISGRGLDSLEGALGELVADAKIASPIMYVAFPAWRPLVSRLAAQGTVVYDCVDDVSGFPNISRKRVGEEHELVESADLVVCSSRALYEQKHPEAKKCVLVPNGADYDHFSGGRGGVIPDGGLAVGYFGAIAEWFDVELVEFAAQQRPGIRFVLIGDTYGADVRVLMRMGNVSVLGERPYEELPEYLRDFDACIIPFRQDHKLARAASPIKLYEYMAGSKPVVSTRLPELEGLDGCLSSATREEFVENIDVALSMPAEKKAELAEFARANSWDGRFEALRAAIP